VLIAAIVAGGCAGSRAVLSSATGHDPAGPPRDFNFALQDAFLLPQGGVLLYGRYRSMMGEESPWMVELKPGTVRRVEKPGRSGLDNRIVVHWSDWHPAPEPIQPTLLPPQPRAEATPAPADVDACSFADAMRQRAKPLPVMRARESFKPGTSYVVPMDARIEPDGDETKAPAQLILMQMPQGALGALPGKGPHVEVVFLTDTTPAQPGKLVLLPLMAVMDGGSAVWSLLRMGPDRLAAGSLERRVERARAFGREHHCHCVSTPGPRGIPAPSCYDPSW
jgi:hypothetical protein